MTKKASKVTIMRGDVASLTSIWAPGSQCFPVITLDMPFGLFEESYDKRFSKPQMVTVFKQIAEIQEAGATYNIIVHCGWQQARGYFGILSCCLLWYWFVG